MLPLITIGMTCHNAAGTIERAVQSALRQDWPNVEIIVVDDCSEDSSWVILKSLAENEPKLKLFRHEENKGYPAALNTLIRNARGAFIAIFDDDDDHAPDRLSAQYLRIINHEQATGADLVFCYSNRNIVRPGQSTPDHIALAIGRHAPEPFGPPVADYLFEIAANPRYVWGVFGSCTLMARREAFMAVGPLDEKFRRCAEWDMAIRAAFMNAHFIAVDRPLITQYKTESAEKSGDAPLRYALLLRDKHKEYLAARRLYLASRAQAHSRFHGDKGRIWTSRGYRLLAMTFSIAAHRPEFNSFILSAFFIDSIFQALAHTKWIFLIVF